MLGKISIVCVAMAGMFSSPAQANESAIGIAASARAADGTAVVDAEFRDLFASWSDLETGGSVTASGDILAAPRSSVAVPSRMPLDAVAMTSGFGMRNHPILHKRSQHNGVDLAAPSGTPVYATADGLVGMAQWFSSYGNYVQLEHGGELQTRYAHLTSYTVHPGDMVQKGEVDVTSRYESLNRNSIIGDFKFVLSEKFLSNDSDLRFDEKVIMNTYFALKKFSLSEEKAFGLDSSSVKVEKFPLVLHPPEKIALTRIYKNNE